MTKFVAAAILAVALVAMPVLALGSDQCSLSMEVSTEGPIFNYITGKPYTLLLTFANQTKGDVTIDKVDVSCKSSTDIKLDMKTAVEVPATVAAGANGVGSYTVTFPDGAGAQVLTLVGTVQYTADGKSQSVTQSRNLYVSPILELTMLPSRLILGASDEPSRVGMSVINHSDQVYKSSIDLTTSGGIRVSPASTEITVEPNGLEAFMFSVSPDGNPAPGHYAVYIDLGKTKDWVAVDVPVNAKKPSGKISIDGKTDDWTGASAVAIARLLDGSKWDVIGRARFAYDDANFYVNVEVNDSTHFLSPDSKSRVNANPPSDSIVLAFDPLVDGASAPSGEYRADDVEFTVIGAEGGSVMLKTFANAKVVEADTKYPVAFNRNGNKSIYEMAIPLSAIKPMKDNMFALSILVNDSDGMKVTQTEWGGGLAGKIDPRRFVPVMLTK